MYKCCLFDLDGTLINTLAALTRTINLTLARFGLEPVEEEHTKIFVGDGYKNFVKRAFAFRGVGENEVPEEAFAAYNHYFEENCLYRIEAYDGMRELLAFLKSRGVRTAVVTNKGQDRAVENIEAVFGTGCFDQITGEREGMPRKPDPAPALYTADRLGVSPRECLYMGDTNTDMQTGIAAGMDTVAVLWGYRGREELEAFHPKYMADKPEDVMAIFEKSGLK